MYERVDISKYKGALIEYKCARCYQIPKILYSTITSVFILYLVKYLFLTEKAIERIKKANRKKV